MKRLSTAMLASSIAALTLASTAFARQDLSVTPSKLKPVQNCERLSEELRRDCVTTQLMQRYQSKLQNKMDKMDKKIEKRADSMVKHTSRRDNRKTLKEIKMQRSKRFSTSSSSKPASSSSVSSSSSSAATSSSAASSTSSAASSTSSSMSSTSSQ